MLQQRKIVNQTAVKGAVLVLVPQIKLHPTSWQYPKMNYLGTNFQINLQILR